MSCGGSILRACNDNLPKIKVNILHNLGHFPWKLKYFLQKLKHFPKLGEPQAKLKNLFRVKEFLYTSKQLPCGRAVSVALALLMATETITKHARILVSQLSYTRGISSAMLTHKTRYRYERLDYISSSAIFSIVYKHFYVVLLDQPFLCK